MLRVLGIQKCGPDIRIPVFGFTPRAFDQASREEQVAPRTLNLPRLRHIPTFLVSWGLLKLWFGALLLGLEEDRRQNTRDRCVLPLNPSRGQEAATQSGSVPREQRLDQI